MNTYKIDLTDDGSILRINWGDPATNETIVRDAAARLVQLEQSGKLTGGSLIRVNGVLPESTRLELQMWQVGE